MPIIFGARDGSELELAFEAHEMGGLQVELQARGILSLSGIELREGGEWKPLAQDDVGQAYALHAQRRVRSERLEQFFARASAFMDSGAPAAAPAIVIEFARPRIVSGLRIHNREDGFWDRPARLRVRTLDNAGVLCDFGPKWSGPEYLAARLRAGMSTIAEPGLRKAAEEMSANLEASRPLIGTERFLQEFETRLRRLVALVLASPAGALAGGDALSRFLLSALLFLKSIRGLDESLAAEEFILRLVALGRATAFRRLRYNDPALITNTLYDLINRRLATPEIEGVAGSLRLLGHGIFARQEEGGEEEGRAVVRFTAGVQEMLANAGIRSYLCYGALLGMIRDASLLPHDDDLDLLAMLEGEHHAEPVSDRLVATFKKSGLRVRVNHTNTRKLPFLQIGIPDTHFHLDIFFGWPLSDDGASVALPMQKVQYGVIPGNLLGEGRMGPFYGVPVRIPDDPEELLRHRYGDGWGVPDFLFRVREGVRPIKPIQFP